MPGARVGDDLHLIAVDAVLGGHHRERHEAGAVDRERRRPRVEAGDMQAAGPHRLDLRRVRLHGEELHALARRLLQVLEEAVPDLGVDGGILDRRVGEDQDRRIDLSPWSSAHRRPGRRRHPCSADRARPSAGHRSGAVTRAKATAFRRLGIMESSSSSAYIEWRRDRRPDSRLPCWPALALCRRGAALGDVRAEQQGDRYGGERRARR